MSQESNEIKEPKNSFLFSYDKLLMIRNDLHMGDIKSALNKINDAIKIREEKLPSKEVQSKATMAPLTCPYCGGKAPLDSTTIIYRGRDFGLAYICENYPKCDAYVGVHKNSGKPLGRLANKELRDWKIKAHAAFDELWRRKLVKRRKERGSDYKQVHARGSGYKWLCEQLGIESKDCHIGLFDVDMCKRVIEVCQPYLKGRKL